MDSQDFGTDEGTTPSFVGPFLYALNRMQANEMLRPSQYIDRAQQMLTDRFGHAGSDTVTAYNQGVVGVIADHTHYFAGFALLLRLKQGVAVVVRYNDDEVSRVALEGVNTTIEFDTRDQSEDGLPGLFAHLLHEVDPEESRQFDVSLVGAIPTGLGAAFHAVFAVSVLKALNRLVTGESGSLQQAESEEQKSALRDQALSALSSWYGRSFSPAYVIACLSEHEDPFLLVDTGTMEYLPIEIPPGAKLGWGIIVWSRDWHSAMTSSQPRMKVAGLLLKDLQKNGFESIESLRDLEHRDLERAIEAIPRRRRAALKHLVSENRNVQKLVAAIRKIDWQFFGALMMISQASKATDWDTTSSLHELVTNKAESASLEGIFGVVQTGEGSCMLVAGQPFSLPAFLDSIREFPDVHTSHEIETFII